MIRSGIREKAETGLLSFFIRDPASFHSGESIGSTLGVSRVAVFQRLKALRKIGFVFDGQRKNGYTLTSTPAVPYPPLVNLLIQQLGSTLHVYPSVTTESSLATVAVKHFRDGDANCAAYKWLVKGRNVRCSEPDRVSCTVTFLYNVDFHVSEVAGLEAYTRKVLDDIIGPTVSGKPSHVLTFDFTLRVERITCAIAHVQILDPSAVLGRNAHRVANPFTASNSFVVALAVSALESALKSFSLKV